MACKVSEQQIIDFVLDQPVSADVSAHLATCSHCQALATQWKGTLQTTDAMPSANLKQRLLAKLTKRPVFQVIDVKVAVTIATLTVGLFFLGYLTNPNHQATSNAEHAPFIADQPFVVNDQTAIYGVETGNSHVTGYAWVNPESGEMFILVDGLSPAIENDYQGWLQSADQLENAGLFKVTGQKGQLYVKNGQLDRLSHIIVSKEPKGGSFIPTDPNPYLIKLSAN